MGYVSGTRNRRASPTFRPSWDGVRHHHVHRIICAHTAAEGLGSGVIIHEWAERWGGAERVLEAMTPALPDADVKVLWSDAPVLLGRTVTESWIARTPLRNHKPLALPLMLPT